MTTVSILSVTNDAGSQIYQAIVGSLSCNGKTPSEALDAITLLSLGIQSRQVKLAIPATSTGRLLRDVANPLP